MLAWVLSALFALGLTASAQTPSVERTPAPAWVEPYPLDLATPTPQGHDSDATYSLLSDEQVNAAEKTRYQHVATRILSEAGVQECGKITLSFDPAYETLTLHKLTVYRDGQALDRLQEQEIRMLQREQGLDRHLYDGRLSAVMLLEDVRVGDTVEYAYSIHGANPILDGRFQDSFLLRWGVPVHKLRYRLHWPTERKLTFKAFGETSEPTVTANGASTIYTWERSDVPSVIADQDLPSWFNPYNRVHLSEFQSWQEVAQWALGLYVVSGSVPDDLRKEIDAISALPDKKAQAMAALRLVQNKIRYLGMEVGVHGYKPYPVETVWKRRFGDCKDKSLVLCAILRQLGMEAYPALVETDYRHVIAEWLPSTFAFDHLVVNLRLDGRSYWLDPTRSKQGGSLDQVYFPNYGKALVISEGATALSDITPGGFAATGVDVNSEYEIGELRGEMNLTVRTVFRGMEADSMRNWLAETSKGEVEKRLLNYYAKHYTEIRALTPPRINDDLEKNELTTEERYRISNFWVPESSNRKTLNGMFSAPTLADRLAEPRTPVRTMPLRLSYPNKVTEHIRVEFPKARKLKEENVTVKDPAFSYSYALTRDSDSLTLQYQYETAADHIDAPRTSEYLSKMRQVSENTAYQIQISESVMNNIYVKALDKDSRARRKIENYPEAVEPTGMAKGFLLAPVFLVGAIGAVFVVRRYLPASRARASHFDGGSDDAIHRCHVCGCTEHSAPEVEFRVASDGHEYCRPHLPR